MDTFVYLHALRRYIWWLIVNCTDFWNLLGSFNHIFVVEWNAWNLLGLRIVILFIHLLYYLTLVDRVGIAWVFSVLDFVDIYHSYVSLPLTGTYHFLRLSPLLWIQSFQLFEIWFLWFRNDNILIGLSLISLPVCSDLGVHDQVRSISFHYWGSKEACLWLYHASFTSLELILLSFVRAFVFFRLVFLSHILIDLILIQNSLQLLFILSIRVFILDVVSFLRMWIFQFGVVLWLHHVTPKHVYTLRLHHLCSRLKVFLLALALHLNYHYLLLERRLRGDLFGLGSKNDSFLHVNNVPRLSVPIVIFNSLSLWVFSCGSFISHWQRQLFAFQKAIGWRLGHSHGLQVVPTRYWPILKVNFIRQVDVAEILLEVLPLSFCHRILRYVFCLNLVFWYGRVKLSIWRQPHFMWWNVALVVLMNNWVFLSKGFLKVLEIHIVYIV